MTVDGQVIFGQGTPPRPRRSIWRKHRVLMCLGAMLLIAMTAGLAFGVNASVERDAYMRTQVAAMQNPTCKLMHDAIVAGFPALIPAGSVTYKAAGDACTLTQDSTKTTVYLRVFSGDAYGASPEDMYLESPPGDGICKGAVDQFTAIGVLASDSYSCPMPVAWPSAGQAVAFVTTDGRFYIELHVVSTVAGTVSSTPDLANAVIAHLGIRIGS